MSPSGELTYMPLFPGWSEDLVIQAWEQDKRAACEKAGLDPDDVMNIGGELDSLVMMSLSMHQVKQQLIDCICMTYG